MGSIADLLNDVMMTLTKINERTAWTSEIQDLTSAASGTSGMSNLIVLLYYEHASQDYFYSTRIRQEQLAQNLISTNLL